MVLLFKLLGGRPWCFDNPAWGWWLTWVWQKNNLTCFFLKLFVTGGCFNESQAGVIQWYRNMSRGVYHIIGRLYTGNKIYNAWHIYINNIYIYTLQHGIFEGFELYMYSYAQTVWHDTNSCVLIQCCSILLHYQYVLHCYYSFYRAGAWYIAGIIS